MGLLSWLYPRDRVTIAHIRTLHHRLNRLERLIMTAASDLDAALAAHTASVIETATRVAAAEREQVIEAIRAAANPDGTIAVADVIEKLNASTATLQTDVAAAIEGVYVPTPPVVVDPPVDPEVPVEPEVPVDPESEV